MNSATSNSLGRRHHGIAARVSCAATIITLWGLSPLAGAATKAETGDWSPLSGSPPITFGAIHMALLPGDGSDYHSRLLAWGLGKQYTAELGWNEGVAGCEAWPNSFTPISAAWNLPVDIYCAGHAHLATGPELLTVGGIEGGHYWGIPETFKYTPGGGTGAGTWSARPDMSLARYYPTLTSLRDGRLIVTAGIRDQNYWYFGGRVDGNPPVGDAGHLLHRYGRGTNASWDPPATPDEENPGDRPSPREGHSAARFLRAEGDPYQAFFGGKDFNGITTDNEVRLLRQEDGNTLAGDYTYRWFKLQVGGALFPPARGDHIAINLGGTPTSEMVIYGGLRKPSAGESAVVLDDLWRLCKVGLNWQWSTVSASGTGPGPRQGHAAAFVANKMYLFGGASNADGELADNQVWVFTFDPGNASGTWSVLPVTGVRPESRRDHTLVAAGSSLLLYGGTGEVVPSSSALWKLDLGPSPAWTEIPTDGPSPGARANHAAIYSTEITQRLTIFGGDPPTAFDPSVDKHAYFINPFSISPVTGKATWVQGPASTNRLSGHAVAYSLLDPMHARVPEIYNPTTNSWTAQTASGWLPPPDANTDYPVQFLVPGTSIPNGGGRVLRVGRDPVSRYLDIPATGLAGPWIAVPNGDNNTPAPPFTPLTGVQYRPGKILVLGGKPSAVGDHRARTLDATTIGSASWIDRPGMESRTDPNILVLPNGKVLVLGDISCPQIWNPESGTWTGATPGCELDPEPTTRGYHSTALLLPDGRVVTSGGGGVSPIPDLYVYCPPYLFNGNDLASRPTITSAPASIVYGESFVIGTAEGQIASVCLIRPGAVTHSFDQNGRYVPLDFEILPDSVGLRVLAPTNGSAAPPGDYLLFILNRQGVPAIAEWVHLGNCATVPCDSDSPPQVTDLIADIVASDQVWLVWTAPGDEATPLAGEFDLRMAGAPIANEDAYALASSLAFEPPVAASGLPREYVQLGLTSNTQYSFALKTRDARLGAPNNWSLRSNTVTVTTTGGGYGGGGFSVRHQGGRTDEGSTFGEESATAVEGGSETGFGSGQGPVLAGAGSLASTTGMLVVESEPMASGGWQVVLRRVPEADGFDPSLGDAIVSQVRSGEGSWKTQGRHQPARDQGSLGLCALRKGGRMVLPAGYALERVSGGLRAAGQDLILALARHSRLGTLEAAAISGGETPELAPGDVLTLTYAPSPEVVSAATSWYLLVRPVEAAATTASLRRTLGRTAPNDYALHSIRPNPTSGEARISFALPAPGTVRIEVFDLLGRRLRVLLDGEYTAGEHSVAWDGRMKDGSVAPGGVYLCRMTAGTYRTHRTMVRVVR